MKIHSIHNQRIGREVNRLLAICGVALLGIATCDVTQAQGFLDRLTGGEITEISLPSATAGGEVKFGNEAFRVVKSSAVRTAANRGNAESIQQTSMLSCGSCGTSCGGSCGGSYNSNSACGSCGTHCGGACGGGYSSYSLGDYGSECGVPCDPYCYTIAEGLYMRRENGNGFSLSQNYSLDKFDFEPAGRVTIGRVPNCVDGCEATFAGVLQWDKTVSRTGVNLQTLLVPGNPIAPADLSSFNNANFQSQTYEAEYYSIELNRIIVGWDVSKLLYGIRYIDYDEELRYNSAAGGQTGVLQSRTENALVGLQAGLDVAYPISQHGWIDVRGRAGLFVDFADSTVQLVNNNNLILSNVGDKSKIAGVFEFGSGVRYQLGQMLSVRGGAEVWYITDVATAADQFSSGVVTPTLGRSTKVKDDVVFLGLNAGIELRF